MSPAATVALLWLGFAGTHIGLSSVSVRRALVDRLGERPFQGVYTLVAFAFFVPLVWTFFAHKHAGRWLWLVERGPALRWRRGALCSPERPCGLRGKGLNSTRFRALAASARRARAKAYRRKLALGDRPEVAACRL